MKALLQRVKRASVTVGGETVGAIEKGILIFLGITHEDTEKEADWLAEKITNLRIFPSDTSGFDHSAKEINGDLLIVSQFTLYGSAQKGRRPDFTAAAKPEPAQALYDYFIGKMRETGLSVATGRFGAMMEVELVNDGPVTLILETQI